MIRSPDFPPWDQTPPKLRIQTLAAVFLLFSTLGWITDIFNIRTQAPLGTVAVRVLFDGMISAMWALCFMRNRALVFALIPVQFIGAMLLSRFLPPGLTSGTVDLAALQPRLVRDGVATLASIALSYGLFIRVIAIQGKRQIRLQTEVALARDLHSRLAPAVERRDGPFEIYGRSAPSSEIGGDLLDVLYQEGDLFACVVDVSGHGIAAGTLMGMIKSAMRMRLARDRDLASLLNDLNAVMFQVKGNHMFATAACVSLSPHRKCAVAMAGHLPLLHYEAGTRTVTHIENQHLPLGVDEAHQYRADGFPIESGDLLALYTDGLTEAATRAGEEFGVERIGEILEQRAAAPLKEIAESVFSAVQAHGPREDDQTLLLIRVL